MSFIDYECNSGASLTSHNIQKNPWKSDFLLLIIIASKSNTRLVWIGFLKLEKKKERKKYYVYQH